MKKTLERIYRPVNPSPAAMITTADENGKPNVLTLGEVFNISIWEPVVVGLSIRKATYSHSLIEKTREFVINYTTADLIEKTDLVGSISGLNGLDKFKEYGLTPLPALYVAPPLIEECPVNVECKVISIQDKSETGLTYDHDMILGEVVAMHADEDRLKADGTLDMEKFSDLLVYLSDYYWTLGKIIDKHNYSRKQPVTMGMSDTPEE